MLKNICYLNLNILNKNCCKIVQNKYKFLSYSNLFVKNNFEKFSTTEKSIQEPETPKKSPQEINEEFKMIRLKKKEEAIMRQKVLKTNMYNFKSFYQIKKFYYENKEILMSQELDVNQLVNLFDNHMKICKYKLNMQLPEIISQTISQEMIKQISRRIVEVNFLSLLKILALNVSRDNKEYNEYFNEYCFNLVKKFDFDKIFYEKKANHWEKISTRQIVQLLASLSKMQKMCNIQYGPEYGTKFFNFRNKILHKIFFESDRSILKICNYSFDDLIAIIQLLSKIEFKHMDLFMKISEEILHVNKIKHMNVKSAVLILWASCEMNILNEKLINICINFLNDNINIFSDEMKKLDAMHLYNLFYFFNQHPNYIHKVEKKIIDEMISIYDLINSEKEDLEGKKKDKISISLLDNILLKNHAQKQNYNSFVCLHLSEALIFFFNLKKLDRVEEILFDLGNKILKFKPNSINKYFEFFNDLLKKINKNETSYYSNYSNENLVIQKMSLNLFKKMIYQLNEIRIEILFKEHIKLAYTLCNTILLLKEALPFRNESEDLLLKEIENFIASCINEYTIFRIFENTYTTLELVRMLNLINQNIFDNDKLIKKIIESAESELKYFLKRLFPNFFEPDNESSEENNFIDSIKESDDDEYDYLNLQNKKLSFSNNLNLLILIKSLKLDINNLIVEKLLQSIITPKDINFDKNKLSLTEKLAYNKLILASYNSDNTGNTDITDNTDNTENFDKKNINSILLKITPKDLEMNLLKNKFYQNILISSIKEFKTTLYIETDKIYDNHHFFDVYIPSLNLAFVIDQSSELLKLKLKSRQHIDNKDKENNSNSFNFLDENYKKFIENEKGISVYIIQDYTLDKIEQGEINSKNTFNYMFS